MFYFVLSNQQAVNLLNQPTCPAQTALYLDKEKAKEIALDLLSEGSDVLLLLGDLSDLANAKFLTLDGNSMPVEQAISADSFMICEPIFLSKLSVQQVL